MAEVRRRGRKYKFTEKKHSPLATAALVLSFVPLAMFVYAVLVSFWHGGQAAEVIGCVGVAAIFIAIFSLSASIREVRKEDIYKGVPALGILVSFIVLTGWLLVYGIGIAAFAI